MCVFILPAEKNEITNGDLARGYLRITVDFKRFFPTTNRTVKVKIGTKSRDIRFSYRDTRSHLLKIGQEGIADLRLSAGDRVCIEVIDNFVFRLSKLVP